MANKYFPIVAKLKGEFLKEGLIVPPLSEEHLNRIEAQLRHQLPDDYREFLRDYGGLCASIIFPFNKDGYQTEGTISMFYGSAEEQTLAEHYHQGRKYFLIEDGYRWYPGLRLIREISEPIAEMKWPEELLPIGSDDGGNEICLALFGLRPGAIFLWINAPHRNSENLYLIADSFDEFMLLLRPDDS